MCDSSAQLTGLYLPVTTIHRNVCGYGYETLMVSDINEAYAVIPRLSTMTSYVKTPSKVSVRN